MSSLEAVQKIFDEFHILATWSRVQKKHSTEFTEFLQGHEKYQIGSCPQLLYA